MDNITLIAAPVLGLDLTLGANHVRERSDIALVSVATPLGGEAALETALQSAFGLALPQPTLSEQSGNTTAFRIAADQIMLAFVHDGPDAEPAVQAKLDGTGYTTDQTDVWVVLEVSGPDTAAALERICPIDLHPGAFPVGASARTVMEHMGALVLRRSEDTFWLISGSSSAGSFAHAVEQSFRNVL